MKKILISILVCAPFLAGQVWAMESRAEAIMKNIERKQEQQSGLVDVLYSATTLDQFNRALKKYNSIWGPPDWSPIQAAARFENPTIMAKLLSSGFRDKPDKKGSTALMVAATLGQTRIVEMLIIATDLKNRSKYVNLQSKDGDTALSLAKWASHGKIIRLLKEAGAKK